MRRAQRAVRERYAETKVVRPKATRDESYEVFLVGLKKRGPAHAGEAEVVQPAASSEPGGDADPSA